MTTHIPHVQRTYPQEFFHRGLCRLLQRETYNPVRKPNIYLEEFILLHQCQQINIKDFLAHLNQSLIFKNANICKPLNNSLNNFKHGHP